MIPLAHIQQWTAHAPWPDLRQVEQDLIISRGLCDLFSSKQLQDRIAFRGGTAIHKLLFDRPLRYSEDIDLIQTKAEPIKSTVAEIRNVLSWLGKCSYNAAAHSVHLEFKFSPESDTGSRLKLKIEINTREHEPRYDLKMYPFEVSSDWYQGHALIRSFEPEELFGTKLRALLQRHKNRDLFDLNLGLIQLGPMAIASSNVFSITLDCRGRQSAGRTPRSGCSKSSIGVLPKTSHPCFPGVFIFPMTTPSQLSVEFGLS